MSKSHRNAPANPAAAKPAAEVEPEADELEPELDEADLDEPEVDEPELDGPADDEEPEEEPEEGPISTTAAAPAALKAGGLSVTLDIPTIMTLEGHPVPKVTELPDGRTIVTYTCESQEKALKTAKAVSRELVKFRLAQDVEGKREGAVISFTFGMSNSSLPLTWRGRRGRPGKPETLNDIQKALEGYKTTYFNSSKNEGIVVADERIPSGLQFIYDGESGELTAQILKSAQVGGGKKWTKRPLDADHAADQALKLVKRLEEIFAEL